MEQKVWILKLGRSSKICHTKKELLRRISKSTSYEVHEYSLVSKSSASDFLKQTERDQQLRQVLGESSQFENCASQLISIYERLAPDGKKVAKWNRDNRQTYFVTQKEIWLENLKKFSIVQDEFKSMLTGHKNYFFSISSDIEWLLSILKCHNFNDHKYYLGKAESYHPDLESNFKIAKEQLRLWKKQNKNEL